MPLIRTIHLVATFYSSFAFASLLISACCAYLFWRYGFRAVVGLFWFKVLTAAVVYFFINEYKQKEYYYYQNLGISKKKLWVITFCFDMALFIILLTQIHPCK